MLVAIVSLLLVACLVVLDKFRSQQSGFEKSEPPVCHASIPFVGHAVGMIRHKVNYYSWLRDQCQLPIVTISLFGSRVYAVFSVPLIQSIQRESKALAFQPIQAKFSVKLCGVSSEAYRILERDMQTETGEYGNIYTAMHHALSPGKPFQDMSRMMVNRVCDTIDGIHAGSSVRLDEWLRHHVTQATTDAVYGPHNPFQNPEVERAFWEFERAIPSLIFLPEWLARHGSRNRRIVAAAFQNYFLNKRHEQASDLVKDFYASECSYGFSLSDRSHFEVGHAVATLANTYAAVFWMVFYVFSNSEILSELRQELSTVITTNRSDVTVGEQKIHHTLDMMKVNTHCPILISTFRESMRLHSVGMSLRQVCKDTVINYSYCLKKDAMVLMPTIAIHTDPDVWGSDVLSFNYRRFLPISKSKSDTQKDRVSPAAFRSFGGGTTLCPGRHFATTQIIVWISMLVMRFDVEPSGGWVRPTTEKSNLANVIMRPDDDIEVKLTARNDYKDGTWDVRLASSEAIFSVTVEDLKEDRDQME
ncbi:cytochrome P450 [Xylaria sp. FL1042]|nr:cytochrome P450 [Xylaria sp. FL1042]